MFGINKVILIGHLGKDPEIKYLEGNIAILSFSLATSEIFKDKNKLVRIILFVMIIYNFFPIFFNITINSKFSIKIGLTIFNLI
jgi:hypothetical protein